MKRILILAAVIAVAYTASQAQAEFNDFALDTLTDAGTVTSAWTKDISKFDVVTFHVAGDSLSGTPAGTINYEYTLDGTEWILASTDTVTNAAETNQDHQITNFGGKEARIRIVGSGTQSVEFNNSISAKRQY